MTRIIGIDPGLRITGYGIIDCEFQFIENKDSLISDQKKLEISFTHIASGFIKTDKIDTTNIPVRLHHIFTNLQSVIDEFMPDESAIEQVFVNANPATSLKLGQARGVAIVAMASKNLKVSEYTALQVKQTASGYGWAQKMDIQTIMQSLLKIEDKLQADQADALACAICHAKKLGDSYLESLYS